MTATTHTRCRRPPPFPAVPCTHLYICTQEVLPAPAPSLQLVSKADDGAARDLERRLAAVARQQDVTGEGLRTLTATAFKRLDEHASGIQRLTMVRRMLRRK